MTQNIWLETWHQKHLLPLWCTSQLNISSWFADWQNTINILLSCCEKSTGVPHNINNGSHLYVLVSFVSEPACTLVTLPLQNRTHPLFKLLVTPVFDESRYLPWEWPIVLEILQVRAAFILSDFMYLFCFLTKTTVKPGRFRCLCVKRTTIQP